MADHGFNIANMSYCITDDGLYFEYRMVLRSGDVRHIPARHTDACDANSMVPAQAVKTRAAILRNRNLPRAWFHRLRTRR